MLKIKDSTGKVVGVLKDDDDAPDMVKKEVVKKEKKNNKESKDADSETTNV